MPRLKQVKEVRMISAQVPSELADRLGAHATKHDRTFSAEVRRAMKFYLDAQTSEKAAA